MSFFEFDASWLMQISLGHYCQNTPEEMEKWENQISVFIRDTAISKLNLTVTTHWTFLSVYFELDGVFGAFKDDNVYKTAVQSACMWYMQQRSCGVIARREEVI